MEIDLEKLKNDFNYWVVDNPITNKPVEVVMLEEVQLWLAQQQVSVEPEVIIFNPEGNKMCLIHKWTKWEQYTEKGTMVAGRIAPKNIQGKEFAYEELRQKRHCEKCNKMQDERVK